MGGQPLSEPEAVSSHTRSVVPPWIRQSISQRLERESWLHFLKSSKPPMSCPSSRRRNFLLSCRPVFAGRTRSGLLFATSPRKPSRPSWPTMKKATENSSPDREVYFPETNARRAAYLSTRRSRLEQFKLFRSRAIVAAPLCWGVSACRGHN